LQRGIGSVSGQSQSAKDQKKRLRALFFVCTFGVFAPRRSPGLTHGPQAQPVSTTVELRQPDPRTRLPTCGRIKPRKPAIRQFLPSREGFNYNTGHFGAGNTVARRVIKPASPRNCRQETYS
jgi:hypothetical protein